MSVALPAINRILIPLDMNRLSEGKLPIAEAQARAFGAELLLLHVIPPSRLSDDSVTVQESQAKTFLNAIATRLRAEGIAAHSLVSHGQVVDVILDQIEAQHVDLLIIGSNVRRGFSRLLVGSVAEDLIAQAPCPVLLVRPDVTDVEKTTPVRNFADDAARMGAVAPRELGIRTVDVARIVGSVGRAHELDESFRVRTQKDRRRYEHVLKLMADGAPLPPVALYKLGYGYYILDGNHRVAAAKELGQLEMDADVTEFLPLGDAGSLRVFAERRAFERSTGLTRIGAAVTGTYPRLEQMVREVARSRGIEDRQHAALTWETQVYRPIARRIRSLRLGQRLPDMRTADIFLEIADCREREEESSGRPVEWEEAIKHFVNQECPRSGARPQEVVAAE